MSFVQSLNGLTILGESGQCIAWKTFNFIWVAKTPWGSETQYIMCSRMSRHGCKGEVWPILRSGVLRSKYSASAEVLRCKKIYADYSGLKNPYYIVVNYPWKVYYILSPPEKGGGLHRLWLKYSWGHVEVLLSELARRGVLQLGLRSTWVETARGALCSQVLRACEEDLAA